MVREDAVIDLLSSDPIHSFVIINYGEKEDSENPPEECFLLAEMPQEGFYLNLTLRNFAAQNICKLRCK